MKKFKFKYYIFFEKYVNVKNIFPLNFKTNWGYSVYIIFHN